MGNYNSDNTRYAIEYGSGSSSQRNTLGGLTHGGYWLGSGSTQVIQDSDLLTINANGDEQNSNVSGDPSLGDVIVMRSTTRPYVALDNESQVEVGDVFLGIVVHLFPTSSDFSSVEVLTSGRITPNHGIIDNIQDHSPPNLTPRLIDAFQRSVVPIKNTSSTSSTDVISGYQVFSSGESFDPSTNSANPLLVNINNDNGNISLGLVDTKRLLSMTSDVTLTIPSVNTIDFPEGSIISVLLNTNTLTVQAETTDTFINNDTTNITNDSVISTTQDHRTIEIIKIGNDKWVVNNL
jgi:hypothetical protein